MEPKTRFYLYRFKLFINNILIPNCPDGNIQISWRSPNYSRTYAQPTYSFKEFEAKIQTQLELEQILVKQNTQSSFLSLESEISVERLEQNGLLCLATLKIDLHDLAMSDHFNEVKTLSMFSTISEDSWIEISLSGIQHIEISENQAFEFQNNQVPNITTPIQLNVKNSQIEKNKIDLLKIKSNKEKIKGLENYQSIMKLINGKDYIINQLQQKAVFLIEMVKQTKNRVNILQKQQFERNINEQPSELRTDRSKSISIPKPSSRRQLSVKTISVLVRQPSAREKDNIVLTVPDEKQKILVQEQIKQIEKEYKHLVEELENQKQLLKDKIKVLETGLEELKEAKGQIYETKKKSILVGEQNELLKKTIEDLQFQLTIQIQNNNHLSQMRMNTEKNDNRLMTCASVEDQPVTVQSQVFRIKQKTLLDQIERLRVKLRESDLEAFQLKRKQSYQNDKMSKSPPRNNSNVEDLIKSRVGEMSIKFAEAQQENRSTILKLQTELSQLNIEKKSLLRDNENLTKKNQSLKQQNENIKEVNHQNQKKMVGFNRMQVKIKQLQDFNKKLQQNIQKQQFELRQKHKQFLEFSYNRALPSTRIKQQKSETLIQGNTSPEIKKKASNVPLIAKRSELRHSIMEMEIVIKDNKQKLNNAMSKQQTDSIEIHQKQLKESKTKMKNLIEQLNVVTQEQPLTPYAMRDGLGNRWQAQQILQQNTQLKAYVKTLLKKVVALQTIAPANKLDLVLKERQITQNQKRLLESIEDILVETSSNQDLEKQSFINNVSHIKELYSEQMGIVQDEFKKIIEYKNQLSELESNLNKREEKLNIIQHISASKRLSVILPQNKWKQSDMIEFSEMKKKEKEMKAKLSTLEAKMLNDKTQFDKQKQDIIKKSKEQQKKYLSEAKQANEKQLTNWKNQLNDLEKRLREKQIEAKELAHSLQLSKTTLENQQRMNNMKISENNIKTQEMSHRITETTQQLNNQILKNKSSLNTIKQLNSSLNKLTSALQTKQSDYQHLQDQYKQFREESEDLVVQMDNKHKEMEERLKEENMMLVYQIERLKALVEDEVIKSVKFQDEYKIVCLTINQLQREVEELHLRLSQKDEVIENMNQQQFLKVEEIRVMEEEYSKILQSLAEENQKYISLKGEYTSLELQQEKAEEHILKMQAQKEQDRGQFESILDERDKESRGMINEINNMLRDHAEKEIEYRKKENEFQLFINKIEQEKQILQSNQKKLEEQNDILMREKEDLRTDNASLLEELEKYGRRDKKKKKVGLTPIQVPPYSSPTNQFLIQGSKGDVEKQVSHAGSGVEGHKSSSLEFQQVRGGHNYDELFTPMSNYQRSSPPNMDEGSQHQFLYPSQCSNRIFVHESHPQIKVTDVNGEQIVNRNVLGRSGSISGKLKFQKSQPLQQVYEQSIQKHSKEHSKDYEKQINNYSDDDSEERKQQIQNLHKTIEGLNKELAEKKLIISDLELINKKNQYQMMETKKYLDNSLKRKGGHRRSFKDIDHLHSPVNSDIKQIKEVKEENIIESLKEMEYIGEEMDQLEEELKGQRELNQRYQQNIVEMKEELLLQEQDHVKLLKVIDQMQDEINGHKDKEKELYGEIEKLLSEIDVKNGLICEFEQVIKGKQQQKLHSEKIIQGLQKQLQELIKYKQRLQFGLQETTQQLMVKQKQLLKAQSLRLQLSKKLQQLNDQLFQSKQESDTKNTFLSEYQTIIKQQQTRISTLETDIEVMADKYLSIQQFAKTQKEQIDEFGDKFKHNSEKQQENIKRLVAMERQKGLLELEIKELNSVISLKERTIAQLQEGVKEMEGEMIKQASMFERERGGLGEERRELEEELKNKDMNIQVLKNDVQIILKENQRLKNQKEKIKEEDAVSEQQIKTLVKNFQIEIGLERTKVLVLEQEAKALNKTILQQKNELQEVIQMENLRGSLIEQVQKNNRQTVIKLQSELRSINEEIQKRMQLNAEQLKFEYQQKLALKERDYNQLKILYQKEKRIMQDERYQMFSKKCELQETRISMAEKEQDYKFKIQKYQGSIKQICGKLKNIETQRPHIQLFQQVAFQNEIFRNRITQLQEIVSFKQTVNNEYYIEELEQMKARLLIQRQEYMNELENYSAQVAQLEQKNYQLNSELQYMKYDDYHQLKEENIELEKSITRLETCEEELRKELQLLKTKREEEYKQYLTDLRALRAK